MSMTVLYLQARSSKNASPLMGRRLFERFQREATECRLGYNIRPEKGPVEPAYERDVVTIDDLNKLKPDVIFLEGGVLNPNGGAWRIPEEILDQEIARGAVVFLSDVDWNQLHRHRPQYQRAKLRIEERGMLPTEAARLIAGSLEHEEQRWASAGSRSGANS